MEIKEDLVLRMVFIGITGEKTTYCSASLNANWEKEYDEKFEQAFKRWKNGIK